MKRISKFLLLLGVSVLMSGCRLAVIVIEGGEVWSTGSGTCVSSAICVVDVSDPNFSETFEAVPNEGWYFENWSSGDRFFCGGSTDSICPLSFQGHEDSKAVEDMVASTEMFYIMPEFKQFPDMITVEGKQWYQPYLFTGLSWAEINAVCPAGECAGALNGYDMTGWMWASIEDVNTLFNYYIGSEVLGPGPDIFLQPSSKYYGFDWQVAYYSDGWRPTILSQEHVMLGSTREINGWTRDLSESGKRSLGTMFINSDSGGMGVFDGAGTTWMDAGYPASSPSTGGWFYLAP